ncbi:MAG: S26 family signal peptidase [Chitinispirillaceae bacterium]
MLDPLKRSQPTDFRLAFYKGAKQFLLVLGIGLLIKFTLIDSVIINGSQMSPVIEKGDRVVLFKTFYLPALRSLLPGPSRGEPILCRLPGRSERSALRVAAVSGDTASMDSAVFFLGSTGEARSEKPEDILPPEYSPRDYMEPYTIPSPGDSVHFGGLSLRDFFFSFSVLKQENPESIYDLNVALLIDGTANNTYFIKDFSLYQGKLDSIPDSLHYDWFFWDRLLEYLKMTDSGKNFKLDLTVRENGTAVESFEVQDEYLFLLGDNRKKALDSRYHGPIKAGAVTGRPFMTLWGQEERTAGNRSFSLSRFGRIIN